MRRPSAGLTVLMLLVALGAGLSSLCLGPEFDNPADYDGDGDDSGLVWTPAAASPDVLVATVLPIPVPSISAGCPRRPADPPRPPRPIRSALS